jgi:hypothetical protein
MSPKRLPPDDISFQTGEKAEGLAMSYPVLYLDFDGCLHALGEPALSENFKLLNNPGLFSWRFILEDALRPHPAVRIVVSSDWRRLFSDASLVELLGPELGPRFMGVVEVQISSRAEEILHDATARGLRNWLALDDHPSVHAAANAGDHRFIACDSALGLTSPDVQQKLQVALTKMMEGSQA